MQTITFFENDGSKEHTFTVGERKVTAIKMINTEYQAVRIEKEDGFKEFYGITIKKKK